MHLQVGKHSYIHGGPSKDMHREREKESEREKEKDKEKQNEKEKEKDKKKERKSERWRSALTVQVASARLRQTDR